MSFIINYFPNIQNELQAVCINNNKGCNMKHKGTIKSYVNESNQILIPTPLECLLIPDYDNTWLFDSLRSTSEQNRADVKLSNCSRIERHWKEQIGVGNGLWCSF